MGGGFSVGGLISGLDSNNIIRQLMRLERQPILRLQGKISSLEKVKGAVKDLRTQLLSLRSRTQDFRLISVFDQFSVASSEETVLGAEVSGPNPVSGAYDLDILQLASSTVAVSGDVLGGAITPGAALDSSGISGEITAGTFSINGVSFSVDPTTDTLSGILATITGSGAGVNATYDAVTDKVTFTNSTVGDDSIIIFGASDDDSNFLDVLAVTGATQSSDGGGTTTVISTKNLGAISASAVMNTVNFKAGAVTSGSFTINGITIVVDATVDSVSDVVSRINDSDAQVSATYDSSTDSIRVVSKTQGSRTISFTSGTSNFLDIVTLTSATQTAGKDSQFTINGGGVQTRNTNEISDAIGGVTLNLLSTGTSTVTISTNDDAVVENVQKFIEVYNESLDEIFSIVGTEGALRGDASIRIMGDFFRRSIFENVSDIGGTFSNFIEIGISTGDGFNVSSVPHLELDEDVFREALRDERTNVSNLFSNNSDTGIMDIFKDYLDDATKITGFLNQRSKSSGSIDKQIRSLEDQIERVEQRVAQRERRLRAQFTRLEQMSSGFQTQNAALAGISGLMGRF